MGRISAWTVVIRFVAVVGAVVVAGLLINLVGHIFAGVLPPPIAMALDAGWLELARLVKPALGPLMAVAIIVALAYIVIGRR